MSNNVRQARLRWTGEGLAFRGGPEGATEIGVDSTGEIGPAPMHLLLMSVGACMAIDVLMILEKGRVPIEDLEIETIGVRADDHPKRYESIELIYRISDLEKTIKKRLTERLNCRKTSIARLHTLIRRSICLSLVNWSERPRQLY